MIFPDDCNRVLLQSPFGDYINASHISMPLPGKNNVLHYIATQGNSIHRFLELVNHEFVFQDRFRTLWKTFGRLCGGKAYH